MTEKENIIKILKNLERTNGINVKVSHNGGCIEIINKTSTSLDYRLVLDGDHFIGYSICTAKKLRRENICIRNHRDAVKFVIAFDLLLSC